MNLKQITKLMQSVLHPFQSWKNKLKQKTNYKEESQLLPLSQPLLLPPPTPESMGVVVEEKKVEEEKGDDLGVKIFVEGFRPDNLAPAWQEECKLKIKVNKRNFDVKRDLLVMPNGVRSEALAPDVRAMIEILERQGRVIRLNYIKKPAIVSV